MNYTDYDEADHLLETLVFTFNAIASADPVSRRQIATAYRDARAMAASIPMSDTDARPRIVACFERFNVLKAAGDQTAAGWMLVVLQERIHEGDLPRWEMMKELADKAAKLLPRSTIKPH